MGDHFNMSGDFRGAIVNIRSTLTTVQQHMNDIRAEDVDARQEPVHPAVVTIASQIVATVIKVGG